MRHRGPISCLLAAGLALAPLSALADTRSDARRYFQRGMQAVRDGSYEEGITLLLQAYDLRPHPNVLYNVARAYVSLGDVDSAVDYFRRYLAAEPRDSGDVRKVLEDLELRQRLRGLVDDGMAAIAAGRHAEGVALLQRAYNQRPHPNLLYNIARAQEQAGELSAAISNYQAYAASGPPDVESVNARIEALRKRRADESAVEPARPTPPPTTTPGRGRPRPEPVVGADPDEVARRVVALLRAEGGLVAPSVGEAVRPTTETVDLSDSATAAVTLEEKEGAGYDAVVVTASRREQSPLDAPNAVTIITEEDIRLSGARSIPDLLRRVPGMDVMAMSYADWNVAMRGFNRRIANKLLLLVDGRTAYEDFLGGVLWLGQTYDLMDIARIEVVRGPGSAIYGANAYAGIVNVITKKPEDIGGSTVFAGGGNGAAARVAYQYGARKGPLGVRASVGYEQGNKYDFEYDPARVDYTAAIPRSAELARSVEVLRADAQAELHLPGDAGHLFFGGGLFDGYAEFYGVSALRNQNNDGIGTNLRAGYRGELFSVLAFWNRLRTDTKPQFFRTGLPDLGSTVAADLIVVEPVFRPSFELWGQHELVLGAEYRHKFIDWNYLDDAHEEVFFAIFLQDSWRITEDWTVLVSYRLDRHPLIGFIEQPDLSLPGSPRLAVVFKPGEGQAVRASIGTAFRQPTQAETYLDLSASSPVAGVAVNLVGSRDLLPEDIVTVDVGYLSQGDFGELELVAYFNRVNNLITRSPLIPTAIDRPFDPELGAFVGAQSLYLNDPRVFLAFGTELATRLYPVEGLDVGASYALQYIVDSDSGDRFTDSPMHKATLWTQLRTRFGLDVGLTIQYVSSQDWIEPDFDADDPSGFRLDPLRVDDAVIVFGRLGYRLLDDQLELALSGTNLLDIGENRHLEHPFANRVQARVFGSVIARF